MPDKKTGDKSISHAAKNKDKNGILNVAKN
jgi:hypothetical protein